jgi:hypothetical protein
VPEGRSPETVEDQLSRLDGEVHSHTVHRNTPGRQCSSAGGSFGDGEGNNSWLTIKIKSGPALLNESLSFLLVAVNWVCLRTRSQLSHFGSATNPLSIKPRIPKVLFTQGTFKSVTPFCTKLQCYIHVAVYSSKPTELHSIKAA